MTLLTALAFVALGFVGGCCSVAMLWKAMVGMNDLAEYRRGFDEGHRLGFDVGRGVLSNLLCGDCARALIQDFEDRA
jgi:hypothetical protein